MPKIFKKNQPKSLINNSKINTSSKVEELFLLSLRHLDINQGQTLEDWEENKLLADCIKKLTHYCKNTLESQFNNNFTIYGDFPKESDFQHPTFVPEDANWARIKLSGKVVLAGYITKNVFNIVFLDKNHKFYKTNLQDR